MSFVWGAVYTIHLLSGDQLKLVNSQMVDLSTSVTALLSISTN